MLWFRLQMIAARMMLAEADPIPLEEIHRRHVLRALARCPAHVGDLGQAPLGSLALSLDAETSGLGHDDEPIKLQLAKPSRDLGEACARTCASG